MSREFGRNSVHAESEPTLANISDFRLDLELDGHIHKRFGFSSVLTQRNNVVMAPWNQTRILPTAFCWCLLRNTLLSSLDLPKNGNDDRGLWAWDRLGHRGELPAGLILRSADVIFRGM